MSKFFVIGDIFIRRTFNIEVEAEDFGEAEDIAIDIVTDKKDGNFVMHHSSDDIKIDNISIEQKISNKKKISK
jgi:hypothetical protein